MGSFAEPFTAGGNAEDAVLMHYLVQMYYTQYPVYHSWDRPGRERLVRDIRRPCGHGSARGWSSFNPTPKLRPCRQPCLPIGKR
jgi:hypothetical protein